MLDESPLPENYNPPLWARDVAEEWSKKEALEQFKAYPTQSLLLEGPSGVGKTTAARWIGRNYGVPVVTMLLSSVIDSYMGSTGKNLDAGIRYAMSTSCVLVMDELDSVSASRKAERSDVGEVWRITNTLIQILDQWHSTPRQSLIVGTTNLASSIDSAIRRRFEMEVSVPLPTTSELSRIAEVPVPERCVMSHADMRRYVLQARRRQVMKGENYEMTLLAMLEQHCSMERP